MKWVCSARKDYRAREFVNSSRVVRKPAGTEWRIGRRWIGRGLPRWRKVRVGKPRAGEAAETALLLPDIGGVDDIGAAVLMFVAMAVIAIVIIPLCCSASS